MAKDPGQQQKTDAERIPEKGTGKLDADLDRLTDAERERAIERAAEAEATDADAPAAPKEPR